MGSLVSPSDARLMRVSENLGEAIDGQRHCPENVFKENWGTFSVFHADWIFEGAFVEKVLSLLREEGSSIACLVYLAADAASSRPAFAFDRESTAAAFESALRGAGPQDGLSYAIQRFACISDRGLWCIYCERQNELALFGRRRESSRDAFEAFLCSVSARRIADVASGAEDFGFSEVEISDEWRAQLLRAYSDGDPTGR